MPLSILEASHLRETCDACASRRRKSAESDLPLIARVAAVRKFKAVGWHYPWWRAFREGVGIERLRALVCTECSRRQHL